MIEIECGGISFWDPCWEGPNVWRVVQTRGFINVQRLAVLGPPDVSEEEIARYSDLRKELGAIWDRNPYETAAFPARKIIMFPVQEFSCGKPSMGRILISCKRIQEALPQEIVAIMEPPACRDGEFEWDYVKAEIEGLLDDRFMVLAP